MKKTINIPKRVMKKIVAKQEAKIRTPYVLERFDFQNTQPVGNYYFRIIRRRGGKTIFLSHPYNSRQIRNREIITQMNTLFRPGAVTITDV